MSLGQWRGELLCLEVKLSVGAGLRVEILSTEARETAKHRSDSGKPLPTCGTGAGQS